ncbi:MAG: mechanosensitive ion channel domain-containing protein [Balneolaceae bacterium]
MLEFLFEELKAFAGSGAVLLAIVLILIFNSWVFKKLQSVHSNGNIVKRSISSFIILVGTLTFILALPIEKSTKEQILAFLGIIISAGIALSSTTVLGNLIAGIMNNWMNRFRNGDLIKIDDIIGRVTNKDIFHTEIQLEDRNIVTIPNLFIATNPVKLTRKTNTVISSSVSIGYDVSRIDVENCLKEAALSAELNDPYVFITELGNDSVSYKIHGFLEDSTKYFSKSSLLNGKVMDKLHENGIEIVSPAFRNQRNVDGEVFIPKQKNKPSEKEEIAPEELVFDEAIEAEETEKRKDLLKELEKQKEALKKRRDEIHDKKEKEKIDLTLERIKEREQNIKKDIENQVKKEED